MDRGYLDFERLHVIHQALAYFVIRAKKDYVVDRIYSRAVDKTTGLRCDQTIVITGPNVAPHYPEKLRRIVYYDAETDKRFVFLTNNFLLNPLVIAQLYKQRWKDRTLFQMDQTTLKNQGFLRTSENAVKTQIWIAISVYVLVAIIKKRLKTSMSLYTILQILSVTSFEKTYLYQALTETSCKI